MPGEDGSTAHPPAAKDNPRPADASSAANPHDGYDAQQIMALARHPPPGASVYYPNAAPSSAMNPRSCVTCRRRKVRCDKHMPCSNCRRAQIPCIFPAPGRAPRRPRPKDPNAPPKQPSSEREIELMKRLRKLEGIVEELSGQIEVESVRHPYSAGNSPEAAATYTGSGSNAASAGGSSSHDSPTLGTPAGPVGVSRPAMRPGSGSMSEADSRGKASPDVHKQFGRLVLNEKGVTRYVSSSLWSSITDELEELRKESQNLTDEESDESDLDATPDSAEHDKGLTDHQSFILGYRSADVDLRPLHPLPSQIPFIWQVYQENVDPILKVVHVPTMSRVIKELRNNMDSLTPSMEALMFSIYYASITSLDEEEVKVNFGAEKRFLVQKYRFALEQALAKAEFLTRPDFTVVQAFLLFLVLVRRHDDTRFSWTLTGLLIRLSQALGLHRDGTHFPNLTPFQIEMRRRVFWAVCVLDVRSAEDQGTDLTIDDRTFDTQVPLNINDSDISPDSPYLPEPREGTTDMAFSLIRYEICALARRMHTASSGLATAYPADGGMSLEEREALLTNVSKRIEKRLLKDSSNPMFWVASNISKIVVAKMTLVIYQSVMFPGPGNEVLSEAVRARLLNAALDVFEHCHFLNTDPRGKQWRWLFQTWNHWHALAYTLLEVSHRPWGPKAERAWAALNMTFQSPNTAELEKLASHHAVWMPLRKLYLKVKKHREGEIARLQADPEAARELEAQDRCSIPPASFGDMAGSVKRAFALERWRKLVNLPTPPPETIQQPQERQPHLQPPLQSELQPQRHPPASQPNPQIPQTSAVSGILPGGDADFAKPEIMDFINDAITRPHFTPFDIGPLLFQTSSDTLARAASLWYPSDTLPRADDPVEFSTNAMAVPGGPQMARSAAVAIPSHVQQQPQQQPQPQQQEQPQQQPQQQSQHQQQQQQRQSQQQAQTNIGQTPFAAPADESLPPWLWPAVNGSPDILRMPPNAAVEDMDMNMDEGFDWQMWQESLGRYELEANGGRAGSTWGPAGL